MNKEELKNQESFYLSLDLFSSFLFFNDISSAVEKLKELSLDEAERLFCKLDDYLLGPLTYFYLGKNKILPVQWQNKWAKQFHALSLKEIPRTSELKKIYHLLNESEIKAAPLKGALLAYKYYPHPALRYMSDFDILVKSDEISKAFEVMRTNGFTMKSLLPSKIHEPVLISPQGAALELHHHISSNLLKYNAEQLWKNSCKNSFQGASFVCLSPELTILHTIEHAFKDRFVGGLKPFIDTAMVLAGTNISLPELETCAKEMELYEKFCFFMNIFPEFFPEKYVPDSPAIDPKLLKSVRHIIRNFKNIHQSNTKELMLYREYHTLRLPAKIAFIFKRTAVAPQVIASAYSTSTYSPQIFYNYLHRTFKYALVLLTTRAGRKIKRIGICQNRLEKAFNNQE